KSLSRRDSRWRATHLPMRNSFRDWLKGDICRGQFPTAHILLCSSIETPKLSSTSRWQDTTVRTIGTTRLLSRERFSRGGTETSQSCSRLRSSKRIKRSIGIRTVHVEVNLMKGILDRKLRWVVVLSALAVTACDLGSSKAEPGSSSSKGGSSLTVSAFSPSNDPRKDLSDALEKLNAAYPYRVTEIRTDSANGSVTGVVDFAAADRWRARITNPLGDMEIITIGDKQYSIPS